MGRLGFAMTRRARRVRARRVFAVCRSISLGGSEGGAGARRGGAGAVQPVTIAESSSQSMAGGSYNSARYLAGEEPVHRLKARQKAPTLENPSS